MDAERCQTVCTQSHLAESIEKIGFGWAQIKTILLGGGIWLAHAAVLIALSCITTAMATEFALAPWEKGMMYSLTLLGMLFGNGASGPLGDFVGRRLPCHISYFSVFFFTMASAYSHSVSTMMALRLCVGMSIGIGQPAWTAFNTEIMPAFWRIPSSGFGQLLFCVGEIYAAVLVQQFDPNMNSFDWRLFLKLNALPALAFGVLSVLFLGESPSYLALQGRGAEAQAAIERMARDNGVAIELVPGGEQQSIAPAPTSRGSGNKSPLDAIRGQMRIIFGPSLFYSTLVMVFTTFVLNLIFYGGIYSFPQIFASTDKSAASPAHNVFVGGCVETLGFLIAMGCAMRLARKPCILVYIVLMATSVLCFVAGSLTAPPTVASHRMMQIGFYGIKMVACLGFLVVYQYATEIYPTAVRATGTAICLAGGRLGGIVAPMVFEALQAITGSFASFFFVMTAASAVNFVLILPMVEQDATKSEDEAAPLVKKKFAR